MKFMLYGNQTSSVYYRKILSERNIVRAINGFKFLAVILKEVGRNR